jgi:phosphonate degradation associated HDIG domain protein
MKVSGKSIINLYESKGDLKYSGEDITQLEHAWQCGQLAKEALVSPHLQLAAWIHDIGHLLSKLEGTPTLYERDDQHEVIASKFLESLFSDLVCQPIALHVKAKRYLVTTESSYFDSLSSDSVRSLRLQGGMMSPEECNDFIQYPFHKDAIQLRYWDDLGKRSDLRLPDRQLVLSELEELIEVCS